MQKYYIVGKKKLLYNNASIEFLALNFHFLIIIFNYEKMKFHSAQINFPLYMQAK